MGTEFIAKTRRSSKKYLDRSRASLCAPDLFKADPATAERSFVAKAAPNGTPHAGDAVQLEAEGTSIIVRRGGRVVGRNDHPHPGLARTVKSAGGFFPGSICSVNQFSSTFEFRVAPASSQGNR